MDKQPQFYALCSETGDSPALSLSSGPLEGMRIMPLFTCLEDAEKAHARLSETLSMQLQITPIDVYETVKAN